MLGSGMLRMSKPQLLAEASRSPKPSISSGGVRIFVEAPKIADRDAPPGTDMVAVE